MSEHDQRKQVLALAIEHRGPIMAVILAMVRHPAAAEDLFQDTMVAIAESAANFDPERDFSAWAKGIARNMVRRHWQATAREVPAVTAEALDYLANLAATEEENEWEQERAALRQCVGKLDGRSRQLVLLRYANNLMGPRLAAMVGLRPGALRTTLARIRQKLRACIESHLSTDTVEA